MSVLSIYSPGYLRGSLLTTQFVANPWATAGRPASDVWIQCTTNAVVIIDTLGLTGFGIIETVFLDDNGQVQKNTFGDIANLSGVAPFDLPPRLFVAKMLSVTFAFIGANAGMVGTATLFQWG